MTLSGLGCSITTPSGSLNLQNPGVYKLEKDTRREQSVAKRKIEASNPFVEGAYTVAAVRENVSEQLNVYVYGASDSLIYDRVKAVTDALDQIMYGITFARGGYSETWTCFSAEYSIGTQHEFQHAKLAVIRATVPRLPTVSKVG